MKKLMVLVLVIGMASVADATLTLVADVEGSPYPLDGSGAALAVGTTVDVSVIQDAPNPIGSGGEITITMAAGGGSATDTTPNCGGPWLSGESSDCCWDWIFNGGAIFIDNGDGTYSAWMSKVANFGPFVPMSGTPGLGSLCGVIPFTDYTSTMAFSFIVTETTDLVFGGTWDGKDYTGVIGGTVNVAPCVCYGDVTGDNKVSIGDLSAIVEFLKDYPDTQPPYTIWPPYPEEWECADVTGDGCISIADLSAIVAYLSPAYAGTTPPYTGPCLPIP